MTYSIEQEPNQLTTANAPMVYIVKESDGAITGAAKFRYIVQVQIGLTDASTFTTIAKIKLHKNSAAVGIVDVHKIIRTYLETQEKNIGNQESIAGSIHSIGITDTSNSFSQGGSLTFGTYNLIGVRILGGYEKASSQTAAPVEQLAPSGTYTADVVYSIPATTPFTDTGSNLGGLDIEGTNYPLAGFVPEDSTRKFLTNAPTAQFVRGGDDSADNIDELTVAFINDGLITDGDPVVRIYIQYHQADGTSIATHFFVNDTASGGKATANDVKNSLLYFGCGTANLDSQVDNADAKPSAAGNSGWAYYRIWGANGSGTQETKHYYFYKYGSGASVDDRHQSCTRFDNVRLAWVNRLGAWDYMNFRGKSTESVDIKKEEMSSVPGTWDSAAFNYNNWDRGRKTLYTQATRKLTINSDWLNPDEGAWLEELFTSTNVQILGDSNVVYPVVVTDKSYIKKTSVNNKIKIQYAVKLEYANKVRTNS